jgi:predicted transcriptional regulator
MKGGVSELLIQPRKRSSNSHRGGLDIIADILNASAGGIRKTYLMYHCNLSCKQLKYYLEFLLHTGLLSEVDNNGNPHPRLFRITNKGKELLKAYNGLKALMQ